MRADNRRISPKANATAQHQSCNNNSRLSRSSIAISMLAATVIIGVAAVMAASVVHHDSVPAGITIHEAFADAPPMHRHLYEWGSYGMGTDGMFIHPQFADTDKQGNVYITDLGNKRVQVLNSSGAFVMSWGGHGKGDGQFKYPSGIAVDAQHAYVADRDLNRIQKFDHNGNYISQWGGYGKNDGSMSMPNGIAVGDDGYLYVVDTGNHRVQKFTTDGEFVLSIGGSGTGDGKFVIPHDIEIASDGSIYVSDRGNKRIDHYASDGTHIKSHKFEAPGSFNFVPEGIEIASEQLRVNDDNSNSTDVIMYVTNAHSKRVLYLNMSESSEPVSTLDQFGPIRSNHITFPSDMLIAGDGLLYVIDMLGHKIHVFATPQYVMPHTTTTAAAAPQQPQEEEVQNQQPAIDATPPVVIAPADITVDATDLMTHVEIGTATAADESGIKTILTNAPEKFPIGTSKVTWIAFDNELNSAEAYQYITVLACGQPRQAYDHYRTGTMSDDVINGTEDADIIFGHNGKDIINGGGGNDCIFGGGDDDVISGGEGSDYIIGGTGNDILRGGPGVDIIHGGAGADFLDGGQGASDYCHQTDGLDLSVDCEHYTSTVE